MKAVILAGGRGSRLSEETVARPKPMVEIGGMPMLWHIMKLYSAAGIDDFVICLGYKGYMIKEFFANYYMHTSDVTFDVAKRTMEVHHSTAEPWTVTLVDTGAATMTGGRLARVLPYVADEPEFCFTYGDGVSDLDIAGLVDFHREQGRLATITAVQPPGRFGALEVKDERVTAFQEKPPGEHWMSGGFFVLSPEVGRYIDGDHSVWEEEPLERLTAEGQLSCYTHSGFWQMMDTVRDRAVLETLWEGGAPPWRVWS